MSAHARIKVSSSVRVSVCMSEAMQKEKSLFSSTGRAAF